MKKDLGVLELNKRHKMKLLNVELPDGKILRLGELPSGDVEVKISDRYAALKDGPSRMMPDTTIGIIPQNRRQMIAEYLNEAS